MSEGMCTCDGRQTTVCHDFRNEPHLVGCPRWGTARTAATPASINAALNVDLVEFLRARFSEDEPHGAWDGPGLREASRYQLKKWAKRYADHLDYRQAWSE